MKKSRFLLSFLFIATAVVGSLAFTNKIGVESVCYINAVGGSCPPTTKCTTFTNSALITATPILQCFTDANGASSNEECEDLTCDQPGRVIVQ